MNPLIIFETSKDLLTKLSFLSLSMYFKRCAKCSIDLTSLQEPEAMKRKRENSASELLSKPSAILFDIETAALQIWSLNP